jgi:adenosine deaminase CECR1
MNEETNYEDQREQYIWDHLISKRHTDEIRFSLILGKEKEANKYFIKLVKEAQSILGDDFHLNSINYYEKSKSLNLYKLLYEMPKGALLHHHLIVHARAEYYIKIIKNEKQAFVNMEERKLLLNLPGNEVPEDYTSCSNISEKELEKLFTFSSEERKSKNYWENFQKIILNAGTISYNEKYYKNYLIKLFNDAIDEGLLVYQGRLFLGKVNLFNGKGYLNIDEQLKITLEALDEVKKREPLFEVNFIHQAFRMWDKNIIQNELEKTLYLKKSNRLYDEMILGFDLVGDESLRDTKCFAPILEDFRIEAMKKHNMVFNYFLHAGECNSYNNENLIDSILLNTPRIGHGINLINQLFLLDEIKARNICLECCPLSNQILNYTKDLRDHPLKRFHDAGVKVTVNSDDDGAFNTESLIVFDYFITAVSMEFTKLDFKQTIINSLNHSHV